MKSYNLNAIPVLSHKGIYLAKNDILWRKWEVFFRHETCVRRLRGSDFNPDLK